MILIWFISILLGGGLLAWIAGRRNTFLPQLFALASTLIFFTGTLVLWLSNSSVSQEDIWLVRYSHEWIPAFGIQFKLAADGLSLLMLVLTSFLGVIAVLVSWKSINIRSGFFYFNLLFILAGITGVFVAIDLFLFYFFWELMLIPMYFLISIWGHENRNYAAVKFFLFTQASGLLMFISIIVLFFIHGSNTGNYTFDYEQLLGTTLSPEIGFWVMLGFVIAFMVKLSSVPLHSWLPDAHTQAPTAGSVILAALLLKTGAYGIIRFVLPLFPEASAQFAPAALTLGVISIVYGAKLAYSQTDLKRLIAYISVSHMGFILLGIYSFNEMAMQGVVMQMIAHGISTGALFIIAGSLSDRIYTRELDQMGGFWSLAPRMGAMGLIFILASLGLPGLGNFVAEILILIGAFSASQVLAIIAATGLVLSTAYSLRIMQKVFYGEKHSKNEISDLGFREMVVMGSLTLIIVWLGLFPSSILKISEKPVRQIIQWVNESQYKVAQKKSKTEYDATPDVIKRQLHNKTINSKR